MEMQNSRFIDFCRPFITGLKDVYESMMDTEIKSGSPQLKKQDISMGDYTAIMGLSGTYNNSEFKGSLVLSWPSDSYVKSSSKMLMREYFGMCDEISDIGLEICSIVMGNAKKVLEKEGYKLDISTPTSVLGVDLKINTKKNIVTILTPFESDLGKIFVELNYEENQ